MSANTLFIFRSLFIAVPTLFTIVLVVFFPVTASNRKKSRTLTGLLCTTAIIFLVVVLDTIQDRPPQHTVSYKASATSTTRKHSRRRSTKVSSAAAGVRAVAKEKYSILFAMWFGFAFLYLLSHKNGQMADMGIKMTMAIRGKHDPYAHSDRFSEYVVTAMEDEDVLGPNHEWAIRAILAKQGKVEVLGSKDEDTMSTPSPDDEDLPDPEFDPPPIKAIPDGEVG